MKQAVLVVDIQASFSPPNWLVRRAQEIANAIPSVATVERHNESRVPFKAQLNWAPAQNDLSLVKADHEFVKHGYAPTPQILDTIMGMGPDRVLVCGIQADTCVLAAGFALFDLGLKPTLIADTVVGSSLDRSGGCCQSNTNPSPAAFRAGALIQPEAGAIQRGRRFSSI
ncbi:MAG: isochorismatase family protein [Pseudomonadota bacterium]